MKSISNKTLSGIVTVIRTVRERDILLSLCAESLEKIPSKQDIAQACVGMSSEVEESINGFFADHPHRNFIVEAIHEIEILPVIHLTVAFLPREKAIQYWHAYCVEQLHSPCVLDISRDESIAAGALVDINGRMFRYVLADSIEGTEK
jgi:hypothetical protein